MIEILKEMEKIFNNRQTHNIPIVAILFDSETYEIISKNKNSTGNKKQDKYLFHAEYLCLNELNNNEKKLSIIVSIPPCKHCLRELKNKNVKNIIYLSTYRQNHKFKRMRKLKMNYSLYNPNGSEEEKIIKNITLPLELFIDKSASESGNKRI